MSTNNNSTMCFMSIPQLKAKLNATAISLVKSPKTSKLFGATDNGINLKVQQDLDPKQPIRFMFENDALFNEGCIVNVTEKNTPIAVL